MHRREEGLMTFTTTASRTDLKDIHIPNSVPGKWFSVTVTPISEEEAHEEAFRRLKGIAGCELDLDQIREERLREALDRYERDS